jgi:hypothetical protein
MTRDATDDLAKLCGLAGAAGAIVGAVWMPLAGVAISSGMLGLLAVALISPAGPTVLFNDGGAM